MAAKRVARSAVDWAKFGKIVPKEEQGIFTTLKGRQDALITKVGTLPEALPPLDFAKYKSTVPAHAATIDSFAKAYAALQVPYPSDGGRNAEIDAAEAEQKKANAAWVAESQARVEEYKKELAKWDKVPPLEHMEEEEWNFYFPGTYLDSKKEGFFLENFSEDTEEREKELFAYENNYQYKHHPADRPHNFFH